MWYSDIKQTSTIKTDNLVEIKRVIYEDNCKPLNHVKNSSGYLCATNVVSR